MAASTFSLVDTRCRFNVYKTPIGRRRCRIDVLKTLKRRRVLYCVHAFYCAIY